MNIVPVPHDGIIACMVRLVCDSCLENVCFGNNSYWERSRPFQKKPLQIYSIKSEHMKNGLEEDETGSEVKVLL